MRFVTYTEGLGILSQDQRSVIPVSDILPRTAGMSMPQLIAALTADDMAALANTAASSNYIPIDQVKLLSPIPRPIHDVMCVGVNYLEHLQEANRVSTGGKFKEKPARSIYFSKRATEIIGPEAEIISHPDLDPELDYEVELAVIIGKTCRDVNPEDAEEVIFGYSVFNDLSSRILQREHKQWFRGKSLDTYTAMGPCIVTKDELPFPLELDVIAFVNGEKRQHSNTRLMMNGVAGLIADLSAGTTLEPGDIIATGTPSGVAMGMDAPKWLKAGDTVTVEIPEIGKLTNYVK